MPKESTTGGTLHLIDCDCDCVLLKKRNYIESVFSPGTYSQPCRPALIPDQPALTCLSWSQLYSNFKMTGLTLSLGKP